jgi:ribosome maturation factor RimP
MQIAEQIKSWGQEFLPADVYVVDVEYKVGNKKLSVYLDADDALTIEQCRLFNRHISEQLDNLDFGDQAYTLEVSSPGVDRPLVLQRQYPKHIGREISIKLKAQNTLIGKLLRVEPESIAILLKDAKKGYKAKEPIEKIINFSDIEESTILVSFN